MEGVWETGSMLSTMRSRAIVMLLFERLLEMGRRRLKELCMAANGVPHR